MNGKMIVGIALIVGIVAVVFLAAPIQAYVNGTDNRYLLQTQQRERLRTQDCDRPYDSGRTQYHERQRINECATERTCNCTMNLEQYRYKNRERTKSLEH
jgi:hypothetical protein